MRHHTGSALSAPWVALLAVSIGIAPPASTAQTSGYSSWQGADEGHGSGEGADAELQSLIDDLKDMVEQAEQARTADRRFLEDLRGLIQKYDWPWRVELLSEDFSDGSIAPSPPWSVLEGEFRAEWGVGLRSVVSARASETKQGSSSASGEEIAAALLQQLLKQGQANRKPSAAGGSGRASVQVRAPFTNAFALAAEVRSNTAQSRMEFGFYQGEPRTNRYLLALEPGRQPSVQLLRASTRGVSVIEASSEPIEPSGDGTIAVQWTRDDAGGMNVSVNGKTVFTTVDRGLRDPFDGLTFTNLEGDVSVRTITVHGTARPGRS
jgi:hypothetical protein